MARMRIRDFGPIGSGLDTNDGFMEFNRVTLFVGNQATGKSTAAKLYSTFSRLEKSLDSGAYPGGVSEGDFLSLLQYHRIESYLKVSSEIDYSGTLFEFSYRNGRFSVERKECDDYVRPKILFIPADRACFSSIPSPQSIMGLAGNTFDFLVDYTTAELSLSGNVYELPADGFDFRYDVHTRRAFIRDRLGNYEIEMTDASSGLQSLSPLALTSWFFSTGEKKDGDSYAGISVEQKNRIDSGVPQTRVLNSRLINIVEEPEQNLCPQSQAEVLYYLLGTLKKKDNSLVMTTHSPYLLSCLTLSAKAHELKEKGVQSERLEKILHTGNFISSDSISIYETEDGGSIRLIEPCDSLPSDDNPLNNALTETNGMFSDLIELEDELCR